MEYQYNNKNRQYNNPNQQNCWNKNGNNGLKKSYQKSQEQLDYEQSLRDIRVKSNCDMT